MGSEAQRVVKSGQGGRKGLTKLDFGVVFFESRVLLGVVGDATGVLFEDTRKGLLVAAVVTS